MILLAGGPSLAGQLERIRALRAEGCALATCNGAYAWALDHGLEPSVQIVLDAREFNARFVRPVTPYTKYLVASQCHPSTLEGLPRERTFLWHSGLSDENEALVRERNGGLYFPVPGGSTVVLRSIPLLRMLGLASVHLFGFDSCVDGERHHAYAQEENDGEPVVRGNTRWSVSGFRGGSVRHSPRLGSRSCLLSNRDDRNRVPLCAICGHGSIRAGASA